jgi:rhomboid protease GluP
MILQLAARIQTISGEAPEGPALQVCLLMLFAFCGRHAAFVRLRGAQPGSLSPERESFWLGTCDLAAGQLAAGRARLEKLHTQSRDEILRRTITARLRDAQIFAREAAQVAPDNLRILQRIESVRVKTTSPFLATRGRGTPVVVALIALNIAMFIVETWMGGSENPFVLHRLGQLETWAFFARHEYWRLVASLFLHFGIFHLAFNLYALFILGPALERTIGALRFLACYLLAGIGSGLGVVALHLFRFTPPQEVVGASGAVMGLVGAWAGLLLKNRHLPLASRRLQSLVAIVVIQTAFDLSTPQVSMGAHLSGLLSGLILGLLLAPREPRASRGEAMERLLLN